MENPSTTIFYHIIIRPTLNIGISENITYITKNIPKLVAKIWLPNLVLYQTDWRMTFTNINNFQAYLLSHVFTLIAMKIAKESYLIILSPGNNLTHQSTAYCSNKWAFGNCLAVRVYRHYELYVDVYSISLGHNPECWWVKNEKINKSFLFHGLGSYFSMQLYPRT